jgi:hypothetical protein
LSKARWARITASDNLVGAEEHPMNPKSSLFASALVSSALGGLVAGCAGEQKTTETPTPDGSAAADATAAAPEATAAAAAADPSATSGAKACCKGLNECKAKGDCRVAGKQDCKGMNECKGQGGCNKRCK